MNIKQGALLPALTITCTSNGAVVDLSTATSVQIVARRDNATTNLFTRAATSFNSSGVVTMNWTAGDTDTPGRILIEVLVTWAGSKPQRFPDTSYLAVDVLPNLS